MIEKSKMLLKKRKILQLDIEYIDIKDDGSIKKSIEGEILDELELHKYCCRRMFLGKRSINKLYLKYLNYIYG